MLTTQVYQHQAFTLIGSLLLLLITSITQGKDSEKEKWDVNNPPEAQTTEVSIDTQTGTWLSLDVSPDGKTLVFDLLGDIYSLPITGGDATPLTSGIAWDMQPRFSPDGSTIAFTSDRTGGDNLWIMGKNGTEPVQVTKESFRLLNSPAWSPDGRFLIARKHFTSTRSLGAGEIWLYHAKKGGAGLPLVERPNDQKDLGEPIYSHDGRYVYYSQDTTPGPIFEYGKDPVKGIYDIKRLDTQTGKIELFINRHGGAIRPTPSKDGRYLAFVTRTGYISTLYIKDMISGREFPIFDNLTRDLQEIWAIHGVYPAMAWLPDNKNLVFWSEGKIFQINVENGDYKEIPFRVKTKRKVQSALRFQVDVAPDTFDVKMLRWVKTSPNGKHVLFQALGKLWIKDLPNGKPRPLTNNDEIEIYPSFSRDGQWVVYSSWDDKKLGKLKKVRVGKQPNTPVTVSQEPGVYIEPTFSPNNKTIVYRKAKGGYLLSDNWSMNTGLYKVDAAGKSVPTRISDHGLAPQFGSSNERLFFVDFGKKNRRLLKSMNLNGKDEKTHYDSEFASEFAISPDGNWLAFAERYHAYVTPLVITGKKISIGPNTKSVPVVKITKDAGQSIHWSGDSSTLHWSLGPKLYSLAVADRFQVSKKNEKLKEASAVAIGFQEKADKPSGLTAFIGGQVITMDNNKVINNGIVLVEDNRIKAVGTPADVPIPAKAKVIDISGKTIMPGLIDVHAHGPQAEHGIIPQQNWSLYANLAFGVTTIHDPSHDTSTIFSASELQRAGKIVAPRLFSTGTILYGANASVKAEVDSLEDARRHLRRMQEVGAFSVKSYNQPRRDQRQQVVQAARELGMMVLPEGGALLQHNMTMVVDGHTGIEHSVPTDYVYDDIKQLWSQTEVGYTPTLVVAYGGIPGEQFWYDRTDVWKNQKLRRFVPDFVIEPRAIRRQKAPDDQYNHFAVVKTAKELQDLGISVHIGAHGQREGLAAHWELWMFAQGGMSPLNVLRTGTIDAAKYIGLDKDLGSITTGKLADLIVIDGDILKNIRLSEKVVYTMLNGRLYDADTINEVGNYSNKRQPFFWESR